MPFWQRGLTWRVGLKLIQVAESLLVVVSTSSADSRNKGSCGDSVPNVLQSIVSSSSSSSVVQVGTLP